MTLLLRLHVKVVLISGDGFVLNISSSSTNSIKFAPSISVVPIEAKRAKRVGGRRVRVLGGRRFEGGG